MSGINEIKKKAKLSIDEMYENKIVGKLDVHKDGNPDGNKSTQLEGLPPNHADPYQNNSSSLQEAEPAMTHGVDHPAIQMSGKVENNPEVKPDSQVLRNPSAFTQIKLKTPTYKMTFNLTEEIYKSFNDLYANRMLQGRKTDKSELICEAIRWLVKMEE